ncbi:MAG: sulfite exporter TauE/SafE family protein, partial [Actinomycetota bacterium]|nr:sulfite exporter TauE/SafE family protein [Actinomycetota bacterium]
MQKLLVLALIGATAQLVDGALGMGYGATSTTLLLIAGLSPAAASASVHLAEIGTSLASGASHWHFGNVDWRTVRRIALPGAVGAFAGAYALGSISTEAAVPWTSTLLLGLGVYILLRFATGRPPRRRPGGPTWRHLGPLGLTAGFVDATGGGGWGPIATPSLLLSGRLEPRKVIGSVATSEFVVALAASGGFLLSLGSAGLSVPLVLALLAGGVVAAPLAAWLVRVVPKSLLGGAVGGVLVLVNTRTLLRALEVTGDARTAAYAAATLVAVVGTVVAARRALERERVAAEAAKL